MDELERWIVEEAVRRSPSWSAPAYLWLADNWAVVQPTLLLVAVGVFFGLVRFYLAMIEE